MLNDHPSARSGDEAVGQAPDPAADPADAAPAASGPEDSLIGELAALIDDGRTYAEAELAFQKTRAALAGKSIGLALGFAVVAIILLHIAFLALAVGLVIALQPLVTIWGAIAIVVGVLLLATGWLGYAAAARGKLIAAMFQSGDEA